MSGIDEWIEVGDLIEPRVSGRPQDSWGRRAKREGFAARSVYKLEEIDRRVRLFKPGMRVLDLGAFPGSWTAYAATRVGARGLVRGYDIQEFRGELPSHASILVADILALDYEQELGGERFDVVLSDMAPNTSGHRFTDQTRSFDLFMQALAIADRTLKKDGHFVGKIFQGGDFQKARERIIELFGEHKIIKPPATRSESYEVFLVGLQRRSDPHVP